MWTAHFLGAKVELYEKGEEGLAKVITRINMPVSNITCPCVGGPDMDWLFITSHKQVSFQDQKNADIAGGVFVTKVPVKGLPECRFKDL